jgi:hypothetical protein
MTDLEVYALVIIAMALCFANWRIGVLICLLVGFVQDPLRKLVPGEPVFFQALVAAPLAMTLLGAYMRNVRLSFLPLHKWNGVLRAPLTCFILLVMVQTGAGFIRTGSTVVAGIGALSYLAPLPAILLGYQFNRSERDMMKVIKFYLIAGVTMALSVYLAYAGYDWTILKQVGLGMFTYSIEGRRMILYSGFLRSPEIAAWHAATAACVLLLVSLAIRRRAILKCGAGALVLVLLGVILLTGRRKFLAEIFLFVSIYGFLLIWFRRTAIKSAAIWKSAILLAGGLVAGSISYLYIAPDVSSIDIQPYYNRGLSVGNDVSGRVELMTLDSFQYVIARNGILGSGAGTGSQGSQYFGGGSNVVGFAAEGGLGKVLAELGIPGLVLLLWLVISIGRYMWSILLYITRDRELDPLGSRLVFGLVALLATNGFLYVVAHQVFGDPFVLIVLGFFLGFVMATPKMQQRKTEETGDRRAMTGNWSPIYGHPSPVLRLPSSVAGRPSPVHKQ